MNRNSPFVRAALRVRDIISEMNYAQHHVAIRRLAIDRYLTESDSPPETYAEFLARTYGPLWHEPAARERGAGRMVG
jgi:hypothetical protein